MCIMFPTPAKEDIGRIRLHQILVIMESEFVRGHSIAQILESERLELDAANSGGEAEFVDFPARISGAKSHTACFCCRTHSQVFLYVN